MTTTWALRTAALMLGFSMATAAASAAPFIAVKCNRPTTPTALTRAEIAELDTFIDERQTAFMMESKANQRLSEIIFPTLARDYDKIYSDPAACDDAARNLAKSTLEKVRETQAELKQRADVRQ